MPVRSVRARWQLCLAALSLNAVGGAAAPAVAQPAQLPSRATAQIEGFPPFTLGSSFEEALAANSSIIWNTYGLERCGERLPLSGCFLSSTDAGDLPGIEGIRFLPRLSFDKRGRVVGIGMLYRREGAITPAACRELHGRTLDYLEGRFGPILTSNRNPRTDRAGYVDHPERTPGGGTYIYTTKPGATDFGTVPAFGGFTPLRPVASSLDIGQPYVSIRSMLMTINGQPICTISFDIENGIDHSADIHGG